MPVGRLQSGEARRTNVATALRQGSVKLTVCSLYQRPRWLTHAGDSRIAAGLIQVGAGDSRHAISGQIARGLFGGGASGVGPAVEDRQPEPAASVAGCGPGWHGPGLGGEDPRNGPPDATRLGPSLQRVGSGGPRRQLDGGSQASPFGGATGSVRADRRGGSGS